jgi:imidazolonepropionase-like amidohydrolase
MERIEAGLLIPGSGEPVPDAVVVIDGPHISYAGPANGAPPSPGVTTLAVTAVMPGMWDCHGHFTGSRTFDLGKLPLEPVALRAARASVDLRNSLDAGITSVREVGGIGVYLARAVNEGVVDGPSIYAAGAILSTTGGHADLHAYPLDWMERFAQVDGMMRLADGEADCMRAVREQLRRNARLIKVCASGGVLSEVDHPIHQQFTHAELRVIVEVAALAERVVAAHCHGKPGILAALEAGVRTIEHGTYLDEECCDAMKETGAVLVPTRSIIEDMLADLDAIPSYAATKIVALADVHAHAMALAVERGVTIAMGTDIALTGLDVANSWGKNGAELAHLVSAGLKPLAAIEAATAIGPLTLGPQAPRSGRLEAGFDADILTLDADPLADITVLGDPAHVTGVWVGGRRVKGG